MSLNDVTEPPFAKNGNFVDSIDPRGMVADDGGVKEGFRGVRGGIFSGEEILGFDVKIGAAVGATSYSLLADLCGVSSLFRDKGIRGGTGGGFLIPPGLTIG